MNEPLDNDFTTEYYDVDKENAIQRIKAGLILGGVVVFLAGWIYGMAHVTTEITKGVYANFGVELHGMEE